jgi:hypothetical protein
VNRGIEDLLVAAPAARLALRHGAATLQLAAGPCVLAGRLSSHPIVLRVLPTEETANADATRRISSHQFTLRYLGDRVEILDPGSSNGTILEPGGKLMHGVGHDLPDGAVIRVAGLLDLRAHLVRRRTPISIEAIREKVTADKGDPNALADLLLGDEAPGMIDYIRLERLNNTPTLSHVVLFHGAWIGTTEDCLIRLPSSAAPSSPVVRRPRAFDFGDATASDQRTGDVARLRIGKDGRISLSPAADGTCRIDGELLGSGQQIELRVGMRLTIGSTEITIE